MRIPCIALAAAALLSGVSPPAAAPAAASDQDAKAPDDPVSAAMVAELNRSMERLKSAGESPVHYLAYRLFDVKDLSISAEYGAVKTESHGDRNRVLDVELRVGSPVLDSTHKLRESSSGFDLSDFAGGGGLPSVPLEDDEAALRTALWQETDKAFKGAQKQFTKVKANKARKVEEEDTSDDFSVEAPAVFAGPGADQKIDRKEWEERLRRLSAIYKQYPHIHDSTFQFEASWTRRWIVTSEGTRLRDDRLQYRVFTVAQTTAEDGMKLWLYDGIEATSAKEIPSEERLAAVAHDLAKGLGALRAAPVAEPYAGPAILRNKAAGVFFHEIFGHRIEGHRQKDEDEGRTFAKKVGQSIMPDFVSVYDDPTMERYKEKPLNGFYRFDDEGVPAQKASLVENGVLKSFLMGRSPVRNFPKSNGHGRCMPGASPVARQGNLVVDSTKRVPYAKLREMLVEAVRKQGKPYGLVFDEIAGGFTMTQTFLPQSFKLLPLRVWKVFPDGRPDELLRGVDIVGTPLASLERIVCAGDDDDTFNGTCGAESGWVPVSASSPSLLVDTIEVERQEKGQERPPLLPAPLHDGGTEGPSKGDAGSGGGL
jgi:predicted Zn-dependent protease